MGQGQEAMAVELLRDAMRKGTWLCLQNVHLCIAWLSVLLSELDGNVPHTNFRLWLTADVHPRFPPALSQKCIKVVVEAPPGFKHNFLRAYDSWTTEFIGDGSPLRAQALFSLAWFHVVMQERRNYLPLGWNKFYEFSVADFKSGAALLDVWVGVEA